MLHPVDPQKVNVDSVREFMLDLTALKAALGRPYDQLNTLVGLSKHGSSPLHVTHELIRGDLQELELRVSTVKKELPKIMAMLELASREK